jgi:xylulokinase
VFWDYTTNNIADDLLEYYEIPPSMLPEHDPNVSVSGELSDEAASELGLPAGVPIGYRAGDQPNNALSLNVLDPGEVAATAGTSGVIYGVTDEPVYDTQSRVNTFVHVNNDTNNPRYGVLLCINGTGIQNSWLKNKLLGGRHSYGAMNELAAGIPIGSDGVRVLPFGNGPERVLENEDVGAIIKNLNFNRHGKAHLMRAAQEGIAFSLNYGLQVIRQIGMSVDTIRVGSGNMFLSPVFREAFVQTTGATVELYDTSCALGAAIGAGIGDGVFSSREQAFKHLEPNTQLSAEARKQQQCQQAYQRWEQVLEKELAD